MTWKVILFEFDIIFNFKIVAANLHSIRIWLSDTDVSNGIAAQVQRFVESNSRAVVIAM